MRLTEAQRLAWGAAENAARKDDIAAVKGGLIPLEEAQKRARYRSRKSGMTPSQAHRALIDAQIAGRRSLSEQGEER